MIAHPDDASRWWSAHRRRYNAIVSVTGATCFILSAVLASGLPSVEVTVFTLAFQALAGVLYLLLANAAYSLGAVVERRARPANIQRFRSTLFRLGLALTVAPFVAGPVMLFCRRVVGT
jgi:hypothetical protein